jgi:hypothetical protein
MRWRGRKSDQDRFAGSSVLSAADDQPTLSARHEVAPRFIAAAPRDMKRDMKRRLPE